MLKLKISGERRKFRLFVFIYTGIASILLAVITGFVFVYMFRYYLFAFFPVAFLALSVLSFWIAWKLYKLPPTPSPEQGFKLKVTGYYSKTRFFAVLSGGICCLLEVLVSGFVVYMFQYYFLLFFPAIFLVLSVTFFWMAREISKLPKTPPVS